MKQLDEKSLKFLQDKPDWYKAGYKTGYEEGYKQGKYSDKGMVYVAGVAVLCSVLLIGVMIFYLL
ncbi:MAG: hypothetical protein AABY15_03195 [Nanoarchaeota archaeon]